MFWAFIILVVAAIVGGSVLAGRMIDKRDAERRGGHSSAHNAGAGKDGDQKLSRRDKINLARVAGVIPSRKDD